MTSPALELALIQFAVLFRTVVITDTRVIAFGNKVAEEREDSEEIENESMQKRE